MIDPWLIYLINVSDAAHSISLFLIIFSIIALTFIFMKKMVDDTGDGHLSYENPVITKNMIQIVAATLIIGIVTFCLFPDKEAMYTALILWQLTPESIASLKSFGIENIQQFTDIIMNNTNKPE